MNDDRKGDTGHESRLDELFDLDFDIDFETAYNMISGVVPDLDHCDFGLGNQVVHHRGDDGSQFLSKEDTGLGLFNSNERTLSDGGLEDTRYNAGGQGAHTLLSVDESYAIENFLNSLMPSSREETVLNVPTNSTEAPSREIAPSLPLLKTQGAVSTHDLLKGSEYIPRPIQLPEIKIPENSIPSEIRSNRAKVRRWKHVYCEKQRRNIFKQAFEELISMVKFPRPTETEISKIKGTTGPHKRQKVAKGRKPGDGKRIPKHVLLKYITEDIELLVLANKELESLITTPTKAHAYFSLCSN